MFSGSTPSGDSDALVATWIFPPFLGYEVSSYYIMLSNPCLSFHGLYHCVHQLSDDPWLQKIYYRDPDTCDLSELMVVTNVISCRQDIFALFWDNMLGVDVDVCLLFLHNIL